MTVRLGDLVEMTVGFAFRSAEFSEAHDDVRLLRGDNIAQGRLRWEGAKRLPLSRAAEVARYQLVVGDVVIAMDRPWIGAGLKYSVVRPSDVPSLLVQRVARLRALPSLDQGFLAAIVGSKEFTDYVVGVQTGSAVPHISGGQIADFEVQRLPSITEQRSIAATLGALDDKIESNRRAISSAAGLVDALSARAATELPIVPLRDLVDTPRATVNPATLGNAPVDHFSLPAFDVGAIPERVSASTIKSNKLHVPGRAILLSRLNPHFNRTWWVTPDAEVPALASTEFLLLTAQSDVALAAVWLAVRDEYFIAELGSRVTGTSGSHQRVRPDDALSIEVPDFSRVPSGIKLAALALLERIERLRAEAVALTGLRDALLPELLSGAYVFPRRRRR